MALTTDQIKQISTYLNYSYSQRILLKDVLDSKSLEYGSTWESEVTSLLSQMTIALDELNEAIALGEIKKYKVDSEYEIEYQDNKSEILGKRTSYNNLIGKLFRLLEIPAQSSSSFLIR